MVIWTNEQLQGEPIYNILGKESLNGVHLGPANEIVSQGTPFSAENMDALVQKPHMGKFFYYSGEDAAVTDFPAADNGLRQGIFLAMAYCGMELTAEGAVYLAADGRTQRIENPVNWSITRDCAVYCEMGREIGGMGAWQLIK